MVAELTRLERPALVSGIWRRIRSLFDPETAPTERADAPESLRRPECAQPAEPPTRYVPDLPFRPTEPEREAEVPATDVEAASVSPAPEVSPSPAQPPLEEPPPSLAALVETLSVRLVEDEALRSSLTDEEFQPLLDWALQRISGLAVSVAHLPPGAAVARLSRAGSQGRELLRLIDLAVGQRDAIDPQLLRGRLELLDTLLEPPLIEADTTAVARARLEALLEQPPDQLQRLSGLELVGRLLQVLGQP